MELKNNQGVLFENKKNKDSWPDFKGELNIDGNTYQIALWKRVSKNGLNYFSAQVETRAEKKTKKEKPTTSEMIDDDLPWA